MVRSREEVSIARRTMGLNGAKATRAAIKRDIKARKSVIEQAVATILEAMDEELRDGLENTPKRVADMYIDEFSVLGDPLKDELSTVFTEEASSGSLVLVRDITLASMCEHHMLPYTGIVHIAYIPQGKVLGLSKFARLVKAAGRGFTIQERLSIKIRDAFDAALEPLGTMVIIEAAHTCMIVRGVMDPNSKTTTSSLSGIFRDDPAARAEVLSLLRSSRL